MLIYLTMLDSEEDASKFEELYLNYRQLMFKVAMGVLKNETIAEDAVHDAFLKVIKHLHKIDTSDTVKTTNFLAIVVRNAAINLYNKQKDNLLACDDNASYDDIEDVKSQKQQALEYGFTSYDIANALKRLNKADADALMLQHYYGFSTKEIARLLNVSHASARARLMRAKNKLKSILTAM